MRPSNWTLAAALLAVAAPAAPLFAQSVGMQIVDRAGAPVGIVTAIRGDNIEVNTDKHAALLPRTSFTPANGKLLFGLTQSQLDSQIEADAAAARTAIAAGATVKGVNGAQIGKIESVDNGQVTVTLSSGKRIQAPISGFRGNADTTVTIGYTAEQIDALVNGSGPSPAGK